MSCSIDPIYCRQPQLDLPVLTSTSTPVVGATANTSLVLAGSTLGTDVFSVFNADATNGSYVQKIRFKPGVSASATTLTVARIFINNGGTPATLGTTTFYDDITLPAVTPAINAASPVFEFQMNMALPPSYRVLVAFGTATANGWQMIGIGGDY